MSAADLLREFPGINPASFTLTSPQTARYNCIAYAAGDSTRWWWPDPDGIAYWPSGVPRQVILPMFQKAFESLGYILGEGVGDADRLERVAFFSNGPEPLHAARQLLSGRWTSKFGNREDASHELLEIEGAVYGQFAFPMHRPRRLVM